MSSGKVEGIHWLGHDAFRIEEGGIVVYTDPFMIKGGNTADIVLITHEHDDHCSPEDVAKVAEPGTVIVATADCGVKLKGIVRSGVLTLNLGDTLEIMGVLIEAVPAYNTNKKFHPREKNWMGYIITMGGRRIYHAGDTDRIPEMKEIKCDIALLPVSGTYVMTADEAIEAAMDIGPEIAIPMHYGSPVVGTLKDAERFARGLEGKVKVIVLEQE